MLRVDEGLSEQGEAVLRVRVELGLAPWAEESHFFSLLSSIGELASEPAAASPSKKHSLVISSWEEREEPGGGSTRRSLLWSVSPKTGGSLAREETSTYSNLLPRPGNLLQD